MGDPCFLCHFHAGSMSLPCHFSSPSTTGRRGVYVDYASCLCLFVLRMCARACVRSGARDVKSTHKKHKKHKLKYTSNIIYLRHATSVIQEAYKKHKWHALDLEVSFGLAALELMASGHLVVWGTLAGWFRDHGALSAPVTPRKVREAAESIGMDLRDVRALGASWGVSL